MAFELKNVVPWGRTLDEYSLIFSFTESDLDKKIISLGDGPASFNAEMTQLGKNVVSLDLIYQFTKNELIDQIDKTKEMVLEQMKSNKNNFVWKKIKSIDELEQIRMKAMNQFILDFELGKKNYRYIYHQLPNQLPFENQQFDLALSSHFLILYSQLGLEFHIQSISEMLRVAKEIRIFPILNLNALKSEVLDGIIAYFEPNYAVKIETVEYEFQKNGNKMLVIKKV